MSNDLQVRPEISQTSLVNYLQQTAISSSQKVLGVPPFLGSRGKSTKAESIEVLRLLAWVSMLIMIHGK